MPVIRAVMLANRLKAPRGFEIAPALWANNGPVIAEILHSEKARDVNVYCAAAIKSVADNSALGAMLGISHRIGLPPVTAMVAPET